MYAEPLILPKQLEKKPKRAVAKKAATKRGAKRAPAKGTRASKR